ncbi:hypothetical protein [Stenotrophomonas maltophilia]|uniref:hypothetical protein n=1 Tax=Stenotrophomonas maltophilia TaxID=40324 RepID=UPI0021D898A8|nr:hypothetical protein [Stenotrophomonas maltophilia]UXY50124.1 hypothetical protein N8888_09445 [Stenotrophomonas maltophilia]
MSTYAIVRQAILDKHQITAVYDGYYREMCPHAIGEKNGKEQALFYQFGGETSKGPIKDPTSRNNWRCLELSKLSNVAAVPGTWYSADNHSVASTCIDDIHAEVSF